MATEEHSSLIGELKYIGRSERESRECTDKGEVSYELKKTSPGRWMLKMRTGNEYTIYFTKTKKEALEIVSGFLIRTAGELKINIFIRWNG